MNLQWFSSTVSRLNCNVEIRFFFGGRKTGESGEKPSVARTRANNKLNPHPQVWGLNPGHIGERRMLSPPRQPLLPYYKRMLLS